MGGDGGDIPRRSDLVKNPVKHRIKNPRNQNIGRYGHCQLSSEKLKRPVVASKLGRLYNKDVIIEYLLDRGGGKEEDPRVEGINSLKDVFELKIYDNPEFGKETDQNVNDSSSTYFPFMCQTTMMEMNGTQKFVFGLESKTLVSEKALREANKEMFPKKETKQYFQAQDGPLQG